MGVSGRRTGKEVGMRRIGILVLVVWLGIGAAAAGQRNYFSGKDASCAKVGTTALTTVSGPLNYVGINPKIKCKAPEPSS
jgi:hypothetical protein